MAALVDTRMPGVYTQEVPTLPPSVALVPTAVPVFIGFTEKAIKDSEDVSSKPVRIKSMRNYEDWFGGAFPQALEVDANQTTDPIEGTKVDVKVASIGDFKYRTYYALQLYFINGGGPCYIISIGDYSDSPTAALFSTGIDAARKAKEITILALPDAVSLSDGEYGTVITAALRHCQKNINRVTIIDVNDSATDNETITSGFRTAMPSVIDLKKYGAAYYPFLKTTLSYNTVDNSGKNQARIRFFSMNGVLGTEAQAAKDAFDAYQVAHLAFAPLAPYEAMINTVKTTVDSELAANATETIANLKTAVQKAAKVAGLPKMLSDAFKGTVGTDVQKNINDLIADISKKKTAQNDALKTYQEKVKAVTDASATNISSGDYSFVNLDQVQTANNLIYSKIQEAIRQYPVVMPPSAAVAGVYVATDFSQGVWKAPANVSLAGVVGTTVEIDDDFHADLNVDASSGKSVNAIRPYTGKGILIFGARTLAGNDLEWRYISVRRTFCFIEDAVGQAMQDFVFAPNTRDTWIKVKAMIGNFLNEIWKAGGLFGNSPDEAYQVNVGEPETMSDVDILEGRMIVEIKLRVARPAEFIILRYEHKFQANNN